MGRPNSAAAVAWSWFSCPGVGHHFDSKLVVSQPAKASAGLVGALAEREQGRSWISRAADGLVGKHRQRAGAVLDPAARGKRLFAESLGLGRRVGVVGGIADRVVARPEAERDDLVRVSLLR